MRVSEGRKAAVEQVARISAELPGYCGALLAGSTNFMNPDDELPVGSDVDIWMVQADDAKCPLLRRLDGGGCIIEVNFTHLFEYGLDEVISNAYKAPHFLTDCIIADPTGRLTQAMTHVREHYWTPDSFRKRTDYLYRKSGRDLENGLKCDDLVWKCQSVLFGINHIGSMFAAAGGVLPTSRRCLVLQQRYCQEHGRQDLHEAVLSVLGFDAVTPAMAGELLEGVEHALRRAIQVIKTPFWGDSHVSQASLPLVIGGTRELIDEGNHREAMLPMAKSLCFALHALRFDAPEDEKPLWVDRYAGFYAALGIPDIATLHQRALSAMSIRDDCFAALLERGYSSTRSKR